MKELDLSYNNIGNDAIKQVALSLSSISTLETLNLTQCEFTAKGGATLFSILAKNSRLKELIVDRNHLDGKRLRILRDFVSNNNGLVTLSMNHCHLREEGGDYISQGLIKNRKLRTLLLSGNDLGDEGVQNFSDVIKFGNFAL